MRLKRASYREAIEYIALNDDPASNVQDPEEISGLISVALVAAIFGADPLRVANDVLKFRKNHSTE